ncbi:Flp family type IVb pilin [Fodinisporobacter ferrooxydans]|uniref:Flp family type IVb pilin n=1 Tax=Fodinisporobacter ferrooxydans TaxID=2901836 RepID=A0ABY4CQ23_9BACL|nr:Flp family type IVb pilin [Alicyclobacillaceae bacterium MYW30-H2]
MIRKMRNLVVAEEGQGLTEYGLILGLIAIAVVAILGTMGGKLNSIFQNIVSNLNGSSGSSSGQ